MSEDVSARAPDALGSDREEWSAAPIRLTVNLHGLAPGTEHPAVKHAPRACALVALFAVAPLSAQQPPARGSAALASRLAERAAQTRKIVYFLRQPETHTFDLYHDYTETREGADKYLNVVRGGSTVSNPAAVVLVRMVPDVRGGWAT